MKSRPPSPIGDEGPREKSTPKLETEVSTSFEWPGRHLATGDPPSRLATAPRLEARSRPSPSGDGEAPLEAGDGPPSRSPKPPVAIWRRGSPPECESRLSGGSGRAVE